MLKVGYLIKRTNGSWCETDHCWEFQTETPEQYEEYKTIAWCELEKENFDD